MIYGFNAGEVFKIALEIEENGRLFYEKAQLKIDDQEVKKIFEELGQEEIKHKELFAELMKALPETSTVETVWDPDNEKDAYLKMMADMHVFRKKDNVEDLLANVSNAADALKLAIGFEKDSIVLFVQMQSWAESDESSLQIGQLVKEEQDHLRKLSGYLKKFN